jgi:Leucine-rich repeat (LRR) protein
MQTPRHSQRRIITKSLQRALVMHTHGEPEYTPMKRKLRSFDAIDNKRRLAQCLIPLDVWPLIGKLCGISDFITLLQLEKRMADVDWNRAWDEVSFKYDAKRLDPLRPPRMSHVTTLYYKCTTPRTLNTWTNLKSLYVDGPRSYERPISMALSNEWNWDHLQSVRVLTFCNVYLTDTDMIGIGRLKHLESLNIYGASIQGFIGVVRASITAVGLSYIWRCKEMEIGMKLTDEIMKCLSHLKRIRFHGGWGGVPGITDTNLAYLSKVEEIDLGGTLISDAGLSQLVGARKLDLTTQHLLTGSGFQGLVNLTTLNLHTCELITDDVFKWFGKIEDLDITQCELVTGDGFEWMINIKKLKMWGCRNVTDHNLSKLTTLQYLDIGSTHITHRGLSSLINLESLHADSCHFLCEKALTSDKLRVLSARDVRMSRAMIRMCANIDYIVFNASNLRDVDMKYLANATWIRMDWARSITDNGVKHLTNVHDLSIERCDGLNGHGLMRLNGLSYLDLRLCHHFDHTYAYKLRERNVSISINTY